MKMPSPPPKKNHINPKKHIFYNIHLNRQQLSKSREKKSSSSFNDIFDMEVPPRFESVEGKVHELKKALKTLEHGLLVMSKDSKLQSNIKSSFEGLSRSKIWSYSYN